jgi:hypothetical protein
MSEEISRPEQVRQAVAGYVAALHRAYAAAVSPRNTLLLDPFSVLAVAAAPDIHLIATRQPLPGDNSAVVEVDDAVDGLCWRLRFYDTLLVPELGRVTPGADAVAEVRRVFGISTWLYHLVASPDHLSSHHARHMGLALAGAGASPA